MEEMTYHKPYYQCGLGGLVAILKTRSSTEIVGLILQALETEPLTRSKIMYQLMLNFKQATNYTSLLTQKGMVRYVREDRKYAITDKGRQFLTLYNETNRLLTTLGDEGIIAAYNLQVQNQRQQHEQQLQQEQREVVLHKQRQ